MSKPPIVGLAEAAEMLNIEKPNVRKFLERPARGVLPLAETDRGPVWDRQQIEKVARAWRREKAARAARRENTGLPKEEDAAALDYLATLYEREEMVASEWRGVVKAVDIATAVGWEQRAAGAKLLSLSKHGWVERCEGGWRITPKGVELTRTQIGIRTGGARR